MTVESMDSPIGELWLGEEDGRICVVSMKRPEQAEEGSTALLERAAQQLKEYFTGKRRAFDLPLKAAGTGFAQRVYEELRRVPFGETVSYKGLAEAAGNPRASRAVGSICGANPLIILVPCHRVICSDGSLGGFALGTERKRWLLGHEMVNIDEKV